MPLKKYNGRRSVESASFYTTQFADIVFDDTLKECAFENCKFSFSRVTFQNATLIHTFFKNKSLKQIRFIDCQAENDPFLFEKRKSGLDRYHIVNIIEGEINMSQNEIAISVQGLKKSYKNIPVLTGVDFQVKRGSIFALLGSNGAGKKTIVKILTSF